MRRSLQMSLPQDLTVLAERFHNAGHQLFVVGGAVRDALVGKVPKDFDVATEATPDQVKALLEPHGYSTLEVGEAFGVVMLVLPYPLEKLEIATFREDLSAGRHPTVRYATIEEDVKRRDLTINALFYDIQAQEVVDLVGGLQDLETRLVRAVGNAEARFEEDRLRILRALRFASKDQFELHIDTARAIKASNHLEGVSAERIRDEFLKGLASASRTVRFLRLLDEFAMWPHVFPNLMISGKRPETRSVAVMLAALLCLNNAKEIASRLNELKYTSAEVDHATFLMGLVELGPNNAYKLRKRQRQLRISDADVVEFGRLIFIDEKLLTAFTQFEPTVTGKELLEQGLLGAELGRELERRETVRFNELHDSIRRT